MINKYEKLVLVMLAGLGAGYFLFALLLLLRYPGEFVDVYHRQALPLRITEVIIEASIFLFFELAVLRNWIIKRRKVWLFAFATVLASLLVHIIFFKLQGI